MNMNKSLIFCIVLTACLSGLAAAEYSAENLSKGLRIGFNRSTLVSADFDFKAYNGYCLGGLLNYRSSDRLSYQYNTLKRVPVLRVEPVTPKPLRAVVHQRKHSWGMGRHRADATSCVLHCS